MLVHSEVRQKGGDLRLAHVIGMALLVEENDPLYLINIGLLGPEAVVTYRKGISDPVQQAGLGHGRVLARNLYWNIPANRSLSD